MCKNCWIACISNFIGFISAFYGAWNQNWIWIIEGLILIIIGHKMCMMGKCECKPGEMKSKKKRK